MTLNKILAEKVMPKMGLTSKGEPIVPNRGRIAHNLIIPTEERGEVLFRCCPAESSKAALGYGIEQAKFELKTLSFLAQKGTPTPKPIKLSSDDTYAVEEQGWLVFAYPIEEGCTLDQSDLDITVAREAGALLSEIITASETYIPEGNEPNGDVDYIKTIIGNFLKRRPDMSERSVFREMLDQLDNQTFAQALERTPKGLVHGDFFFENVLSRDGHLVGVIDFGDAYQGCLLMDVAIGSMEFAMKEGENWDFDLHEAFLKSNQNWLSKNQVSCELFHGALLANCARFTAHLCNLAQDKLEENKNPNGEIDLSDNQYVGRFYMFRRPEVKTELQRRYEAAIF